MIKQAYLNGFVTKCSEYGVNGLELLKTAGFLDTPPPEVVGADGATVEKWIATRDAAVERMQRASERRQAQRATAREELKAKFQPKNWLKNNFNPDNWYNRQARALSDAFASSRLVNNTGWFGKDLGFALTPSAMVRKARNDTKAIAQRSWDYYRSSPRALNQLSARDWNKTYWLKELGYLPERLYPGSK